MGTFVGSKIVKSGSLISLIDAANPKHATSGNINDLISNNDTFDWARQGTVSNTVQDGVACWNMDTSYLQTTTRKTLAQNYVCFYLWKPRVTNSGWRTVHRGNSDHWGIIQSGGISLGMYSNRSGGFRDSGYDITANVWQTWIIVGTGTSSTSNTGTSRHYVNGVDVGTSDRVGCGTQTYRIGWSGQGPGKIAVAGVLNDTTFTAEDAKNLHYNLFLRV
jgi:hypothetical protein